MRCNQVTITIDRFGEYVPKNYPSNVQRIHVYCDDFKSVYAALPKAYAMAINELAQYEDIGVRTDVYTNEFSNGDRKLHGVLPNDRILFEEDINLEYYDMNMQVCSDFLWAHEHSGEIVDTIKKCIDEHEMKVVLKKKFGLDDYQVKKLSQIRLGMLTKEEYLTFEDKLENIEKMKSEAVKKMLMDEFRQKFNKTYVKKDDRNDFLLEVFIWRLISHMQDYCYWYDCYVTYKNFIWSDFDITHFNIIPNAKLIDETEQCKVFSVTVNMTQNTSPLHFGAEWADCFMKMVIPYQYSSLEQMPKQI